LAGWICLATGKPFPDGDNQILKTCRKCPVKWTINANLLTRNLYENRFALFRLRLAEAVMKKDFSITRKIWNWPKGGYCYRNPL